MKDQINTIREALKIEGFICTHGSDAPVHITEALTAIAQLEAMVGEQELVAWTIAGEITDWSKNFSMYKTQHYTRPVFAAPVAQQYEAGDMASAAAQGFRDGVASVAQPQEPVAYYYQKHNCFGQLVWNVGFVAPGDATYCYPLYTAAPVAQQPQEIEVQCPVCNHKFYEWPNDKQPQAEAVPVVDRVYEAAKRLVDHADFQLGGVLSAKSKARDIPSNAASKVKARHLASLRDALAKTPQQAEAVPSDVTDAMVDAYLKANDAYWRETDTQPKSPTKWRNGNPKEATRVSLAAAIAQQKGQP